MTLTCPRCDGTGLIDVCWNNDPNREDTILCDYCHGEAIMRVDDEEVASAEFWGQRCKDYLSFAAQTAVRFEKEYFGTQAAQCAVYAGTCGCLALDNADPIVRIDE